MYAHKWPPLILTALKKYFLIKKSKLEHWKKKKQQLIKDHTKGCEELDLYSKKDLARFLEENIHLLQDRLVARTLRPECLGSNSHIPQQEINM